MAKSCIIIGASVAGPATALTLSRIGVSCSIYELRDGPAAIDGAVNLTPNALRLLEDLKVTVSGCMVECIEIFSIHTGRLLGEVPFRKNGHAPRAMRKDFQDALLKTVDDASIEVIYGSKLISIKDDSKESQVTATLANGTSAKADFIVGCDGIHSGVRKHYVEPDRALVYTGVAAAYTVIESSPIKSKIHFKQTAAHSGQRGSLFCTYVDQKKSKIYFAAIMETPEQQSKQGWRALGADHESATKEIRRRYGESVLPCLSELIDQVTELYFYPVYKLEQDGKWSSGRAILLSDAAHAVCTSLNT